MDQSTCIEDDCSFPGYSRGWCRRHYHRVLKHGDPRVGAPFRITGQAVCSIPDCDRKTKSRGYCNRHYLRDLRHGNPLAGDPERDGTQGCVVDGCDRRHDANGYCNRHYLRVYFYGDPNFCLNPHDYQGTYSSAHSYIRRQLGKAADRECVDCGGRAKEWSYVGGAPDERLSDKGFPYTYDPSFYRPRCARCHIRFDRREGRANHSSLSA